MRCNENVLVVCQANSYQLLNRYLNYPVRLYGTLTEANVKHVFYESPGTSHEWQTNAPRSERLCAAAALGGKQTGRGLAVKRRP